MASQIRRRNASAKITQKLARQITEKSFVYHRVGFDRRLMTFLPKGRIGQGARNGEVFWKLNEKNGMVFLEICSKTTVTCRLQQDPDLVWRGRWIDHERMPVELVPNSNLRHKSENRNGQLSQLPQSLFVVSLPRSLSTMVYHQACKTIGLATPSWTSDGEILNVDRHSLFAGPTSDTSHKFTCRRTDPRTFFATTDFLDQLVKPIGYAYKDVVQPFVISAWLKRTQMRTIRIKRNVADVAYSMIERDWYYPANVVTKRVRREDALVRGLVQAEKALDSILAEQINFDELIDDEQIFKNALVNLFGHKWIDPVKFIDANFKTARSRILARRKTQKYKKLVAYAEKAAQTEVRPTFD